MSLYDLMITLIIILITPTIISWIQNRPVEGSIGIIDLIIPQQDPRDRILSFSASFILPFVLGFCASIGASNKLIVSTFGIGIGALMSVSAVFFRTETLAPPIRSRILAARVIYASFVFSYICLGLLGTYCFTIVSMLLQNEAIKEEIIVSIIATLVLTLVVETIKLLGGKLLLPPKQIVDINQEQLMDMFRNTIREELKYIR